MGAVCIVARTVGQILREGLADAVVVNAAVRERDVDRLRDPGGEGLRDAVAIRIPFCGAAGPQRRVLAAAIVGLGFRVVVGGAIVRAPLDRIGRRRRRRRRRRVIVFWRWRWRRAAAAVRHSLAAEAERWAVRLVDAVAGVTSTSPVRPGVHHVEADGAVGARQAPAVVHPRAAGVLRARLRYDEDQQRTTHALR